MTDFQYWILPFGYIPSVERASIPELIEGYLADDSKLKSMKMIKEVQFNVNALRQMIYYVTRLVAQLDERPVGEKTVARCLCWVCCTCCAAVMCCY